MSGRERMTRDEAMALVDQVGVVHIATVVDGRPLARTMHAVAVDGDLVLHGGLRGEKTAWDGAPAVATAERVVVQVPSWMRHPERACPATTLYRSVQVDGHLDRVEDAAERARLLQAMMVALQPEGRHAPITDGPVYRKALRALSVWALRGERWSGVVRLGQHWTANVARRVVAGLWERGAPGDLAAIEDLRRTHPARPVLPGDFGDLLPRVHPTTADIATAVTLCRGTYWNVGRSDADLARAHRSGGWVGLERDGRLVATARIVGDGVKFAWLADVVVAADQRGRGVGTRLIRLALAHPAARGATMVLRTKDAMGFYRRLGFTDDTPPGRTTMARRPQS